MKKKYNVIGDSALKGAVVEIIKPLLAGGNSCRLLEDFSNAYKKGDQVVLDSWELKGA